MIRAAPFRKWAFETNRLNSAGLNTNPAEAETKFTFRLQKPRQIGHPMSPPTASKPNTSAILAIILLSYVMIVLDTSIVITGLPKNNASWD